MTFLPKQDVVQLARISSDLPHALVVYSDDGLDREGAIQSLISNNDEVVSIEPLDEKAIISIEQIRNLISYLSTTSDRRRIAIIKNSELMTEQAQNSFLKSLEEPRQNTHFILGADKQSSLLETIISRCQTVQLHLSTIAEDNEQLTKYNLPDIERRQILFIAKGRPILINQLATSPEMLKEYGLYVNDARTILSREDPYGSIRCVQNYFKDRQQAILLLDTLANLTDFQVKTDGSVNPRFKNLLRNIDIARKSIRLNGSIKLALLLVVV